MSFVKEVFMSFVKELFNGVFVPIVVFCVIAILVLGLLVTFVGTGSILLTMALSLLDSFALVVFIDALALWIEKINAKLDRQF